MTGVICYVSDRVFFLLSWLHIMEESILALNSLCCRLSKHFRDEKSDFYKVMERLFEPQFQAHTSTTRPQFLPYTCLHERER